MTEEVGHLVFVLQGHLRYVDGICYVDHEGQVKIVAPFGHESEVCLSQPLADGRSVLPLDGQRVRMEVHFLDEVLGP
ncbi:MAG TPA: hypothetical protein DCQ64_00905 [Candidatus Rokubacteria bacterium]|nr:hypothetical protein [Candidatus Rokubacteria bacterium]